MLLSGLYLLCACDRRPTEPPPPPPDRTAPAIRIEFPTSTRSFDEDGDGLVDLRVDWSDSAGAVDLSGVRVRSIRGGVNGPLDGAANLLPGWRVERLDSTGLVVHETVDNLLHWGFNELEVTVPDTAGNVRVDSMAVELPAGALMTTLRSGQMGGGHIVDAVECADDGLVYMTAGLSMLVVDPVQLKILADVKHPSYVGGTLEDMLCVPGDPYLYVTPGIYRFDRRTRQWTGSGTKGVSLFDAIQLSRVDPNLIYATGGGGLGRVERSTNTYIDGVPVPPPTSFYEESYALAIMPVDKKIYMARLDEGGILVVDPKTGEIRKRIKISGPNWDYYGRTDDFKLSADSRHLYVAVLDGDPRGVAEIDTRTDSITRFFATELFLPQVIALSPSGKRAFVTTQDRFPTSPSSNFLLDLVHMQGLAYFPRPRAEGETRFDGGAVFRADGKLVFVGHNLDVDVYLNRE